MKKRAAELRAMLQSIHKKSYPAYKSLRGAYDFGRYELSIDHVQGDPFAAPSSVSVRIPHTEAGFPNRYYEEDHCRIAMEDHLLRLFGRAVRRYSFQAKGSGKSGLIEVSAPGQEILERTACQITKEGIIVRFHIGFPANGRTINAPELEKILFDFLPASLDKSFWYANVDQKALQKVYELSQDQAFIRRRLTELHLCAFIADGAILPRQTGVSDLPMKDSIPFSAPDSLRIELELPYHGRLSGMGLQKGITLIVGGGYHGKSTLLQALERGVYPHIAGDGREFVITDPTAVKLRAEDGRSIRHVDISLFINDLPNQKDTHDFSTPDASGSTSQAAGIVESLEAGTELLLIDEDTSATNFMVRDTFMQQMISREKEPITSFLERARDLYEKAGCSTVLVAGSSGAFFHIADTVLQMDCYRPLDITQKVKAACTAYPLLPGNVPPFVLPDLHRTLSPSSGRTTRTGRPDGRTKVKVHDKDSFYLGKETIDLRYVEQLVDREQTAALSHLLKYAEEHLLDGRHTLRQIVQLLEQQIRQKGLGSLAGRDYVPAGLAMPRTQEIFACFNRYRG